MILTKIGKLAARKKESSLEYELKNYIFIGSSAYSMEIELPLADYSQNLDIFGMITRKDVVTGDIFFFAVLKRETPQVRKTDSRGLVLEA